MKQILDLKIVFITILLTRIFLFLVWNSAWFIPQKTDFWKHLYTGFIIIAISFLFKNKFRKSLFSIGIALVIDEFIYIFVLLGLVDKSDYWSLETILFIFIGYISLIVASRVLKK